MKPVTEMNKTGKYKELWDILLEAMAGFSWYMT